MGQPPPGTPVTAAPADAHAVRRTARRGLQGREPVRVLSDDSARAAVISKQVVVNGTKFKLTLTEPVIDQVKTLKGLYATAYEDPDAFEDASSEISLLVREIALAVEPDASDGDLDGLMQEIIRVVDSKDAEVARQRSGHEGQSRDRSRRRSRRR